MITLTGVDGTAEFEAAKLISEALKTYWPGLEESPSEIEDVKVSANVKVAGYETSDIDVVICGRLRPGRKFFPCRAINDRDGNPCGKNPISVYNLAVAVEVKSHSQKNIKFQGETVHVQYVKNGVKKWHDATGQNEKQLYTLQKYFDSQHAEGWIYRLIILDSLAREQVPSGVLTGKFKADELLTEIAALSPPRRIRSGLAIRSFSFGDKVNRAIDAPIFWQTTPTNLDRKKMDRVAKKRAKANAWSESVGREMLIFRGRGGAGKTVLLLQSAYQLFKETGSRSILLTYNHALVADVRRSMSLMNVPSSPDEGGIAVRTVMSFVLSWLHKLGVFDEANEENDIDLDQYPKLCAQAMRFFTEEAVTQADVEAIKEANPDRFDFDLILVDEGQDWPHEEAELITRLYPSDKLMIADGFDQLIRGTRSDWTKIGHAAASRKVVPLRRCLRMKANLAHFANSVAERAGISWEVEPNDQAGGGSVIIIEGPYLEQENLHTELLSAAEISGNEPVDFLFCVAPSNLIANGNRRESVLATSLREDGYFVWDGTDQISRKEFPRGTKTHRVVQYESCRGLEGWVVVAEGFDDFWSHKKAVFEPDQTDPDLFKTGDELAAEWAWRWCMILMTRPIDTLVITLSDPESISGIILKEVSKDIPDIVEWRS